MIERQLQHQLDRVAWKFRRLALFVMLAVVWSAVAASAALVLAIGHASDWHLPGATMIFGSIAVLLTITCVWLALRTARNYLWVAQKIEAAYPQLDSCLLAAVEQEPQLAGGRFGFMQESVIRQAVYHGISGRWQRVVPIWRTALAMGASFVSLVVLTVVMSSFKPYPSSSLAMARLTNDKTITQPSVQFSVTVKPGSTEVERGTSLLVTAHFKGQLPPDATLIYSGKSGDTSQLEMSTSLSDPVYGGRIMSIDQPLTYHVAFAERKSKSYRVGVFEFPKLNRADAELIFPKYTSMEKRMVQDVRHVSAIEGTQLTLLCHLNKPVKGAKLVGKGGEMIELSRDSSSTNLYSAEIKIERSLRLVLHLTDDAGRKNKQPPEFVINALPNKPPDLKLAQPSRDVQVSPIEELTLKASAWDDFGLSRIGVRYEIPGAHSKDIILANHVAGKERVDIQHLVAFEELDAEPDQLLAYHFWAEDIGPDGKPRRTASDMYFAEVRHFEEIFRQGQQPPGGSPKQQGGNAQEAQKIAELQKEIINATWKIVRRETGSTPSDRFAEDAQLLVESQSTALEQATALAEKLQYAQSKKHMAEVQRHMQAAVTQLTKSKEELSVDTLQPALATEQAAYQVLLKLRAREHQVIQASQQQQQSSSSSSQQSNRSQQQLNQLELKNDENRYETQRTAQPQQDAQDRETRQVLNRLRELARRQNDLNKRIKELQSSLDEAKTEEEKEEIRRQLKRLRDEQQQILRDTDELRSRMDQPQNQQEMNETREQLDQTRENIRQSAEALKEGLVTQAAAAGTRAQREFEELREEFRKRASGQFNEEMRQMRQQAKELDEKEKDIADQIAELTKPKNEQKKSLSDSTTEKRETIQKETEKQRDRLGDLLDRMRQTVEDAEQSEPLLAEQLYDAFRETQQSQVDRALDATSRSLQRGLVDDARQLEEIARGGIGELRKGIDKAAENVLGDETEALRRAQEELKDLAKQLGDEVAQADPRESDEQNGTQSRQTSPENQDGNNPGGDQKPSDQNQQRAGSPSESKNQPGQGRNNPSQSKEQNPSQQQGDGQQPGNSPSNQQSNQPGNQRSQNSQPQNAQSQNRLGGLDQFLNESGSRGFAPISGGNFVQWADRLRDVEEMIDDPELSAEAARIRDRARGIRADSRRHSKPPNWNLVRMQVLDPLNELRDRVAEELLKRVSKDAIVPIDRDPVPPKYAEQVRRYYERLGAGK